MVACSNHPRQPISRRDRTGSDTGTEPDARNGNTASGQPRPGNGGTGFGHGVSNSGHRSPGTWNGHTAAGNDGTSG